MTTIPNTFTARFFKAVTAKPKLVIAFSLLLIGLAASFLPQLYKDTTADAFIAKDNPALIYKDKVKDIFGLADPMVMAIINKDGVFNPKTLQLVYDLNTKIEKLPNVDPDRITSLATESNIYGDEEGMIVEDFFDPYPPETQAEADAVKAAIDNFPLYQGSLVARDGTATLIVAELVDDTKAEQTYKSFMQIAEEADLSNGEEIHVAGEGAIAGYLGAYIDNDAQRLNPLAGIIITIVLFIAYLTLRGTILPNVVVGATVASALGVMAASGIAFFVVTNALIVILIGIAVADSIHIFSQYYEEKAKHPNADSREIVVRAMSEMLRPITLTSLTTVAGFLGLYLASEMPPFRYLGLFSALGVAVAWLYTITFLPAALSLLKIKPSKVYKVDNTGKPAVDRFGKIMAAVGAKVIAHSRTVVAVGVLVMALGIYGALNVQVNEDRIDTFHASEPIYKADKVINATMDGTNNLDIVIETPNPEDLFEPANLAKIEALQAYVESLPTVGGSTSVVDYIKQMYKSLNGSDEAFYVIPDDKELIAQLFLLYSASGEPTDFEEEIDYDYQRANIRVNINTGLFTENKRVIDAMQAYIDSNFNQEGVITATLSGRVNLNYHWVAQIGESHFLSMGIALVLVLIMACIVFRSVTAGLFALIPVMAAILLIYAVMGVFDIWLGIGTSMFASVAVGLGVDFAIHTIDRIKHLFAERRGESFDETIADLFPSTGRALLFNFLAIGLGFGVLMVSDVVPLFRFGGIVLLAVSASFIASMTLLPALIKVIRPGFIANIAARSKTNIQTNLKEVSHENA
jgi:hypothetical protein